MNFQESSKFGLIIYDKYLIIFYLELGLLTRHRDIRDGYVIRDSPSNRVNIFVTKVYDMDCFRWALDVRFDDHVWLVDGPLDIKQENSLVRVAHTLHKQIEGLFAKLTIEIFPIIRTNSHLSLKLLLTVCPLA